MGDIQVRGDDLLVPAAQRQALAQRSVDGGVAAVLDAVDDTAGAGAGEIAQVLNGPGAVHDIPHQHLLLRPLGHQELHQGAPEHLRAEQLREADIVADHQTTWHAVQGEIAGRVAGPEGLILPGGAIQMDLVILGDHLPLPVKDAGSIVEMSVGLSVHHRPGDDVDVQFLRQGGEGFPHLGAVLIREVADVPLRREARGPGLRQGDDIRVLEGGLPHQLLRVSEILTGRIQLDIHLKHTDSHDVPPVLAVFNGLFLSKLYHSRRKFAS